MDLLFVGDKSIFLDSDFSDITYRLPLQSLCSAPEGMISSPFGSNSMKQWCQETGAMVPLKLHFTDCFAQDLGDARIVNGLHLPMATGRGAFTAEQWVELHRQALIFKCIVQGLSLPPALLINSTIPNLLGSATYSSMRSRKATDLEPGRCRRTDGKKWRCARDVVPYQKYCERHINRGRNRARKSAALQPSSNSTPPLTNNPCHESSISPSPSKPNSSPLAVKNFSLPFSFANEGPRFLLGGNLGFSPNLCNSNQRLQLHNGANLSFPYQTNSLASSQSIHTNQIQLSTDKCKNLLNDWAPSKDSAAFSWQCFEDCKVGKNISRNRHSIATPTQIDCMFSSNGCSQTGKEFPCLKLFAESECIGLDMGQQHEQRQQSWVDISWEEPVGGPLAEVVLHSSSGTGGHGLGVFGKVWDGSPEGSSGEGSPRGVLKEHAFGLHSSDISSSSSSSATSPATSIKRHPTTLG